MNDQPQQLALSNQEAISRSQQSTTNQETNQETSQVTSQETSQETNQETTSQSQSDTMADSQIDPQDDESAYNFADVSQYEKISKIGQGKKSGGNLSSDSKSFKWCSYCSTTFVRVRPGD